LNGLFSNDEDDHDTGRVHKFLIRSGQFIVAAAALWAMAASLYILFYPVTINGVTSTLRRDSGELVDVFTRQQSWYETQGLWGVLVIVIFGGFYLLAARVAWKGNYKVLTIMGIVGIVLSIVTGFSIGGAYLPSALGLFVAALMLLSSRGTYLQKPN
jgi:hypothetical protein